MDEYQVDSRNRLMMRFIPDDEEDLCRLAVEAATDGFSGVSTAWFNTSKLIEFASTLDAFPLTEHDRHSISSGLTPQSGEHGGVYFEMVGVRIHPVGVRGQVGVLVHLSTGPDQMTNQMTLKRPRGEVHLELLTTYERTRLFGDHLLRMIQGEFSEAEIGGEILF